VHAACSSTSIIPGTWTNANGNIGSCVTIQGISPGGKGVVSFESTSPNLTFTAAGNNVYDDMGSAQGTPTISINSNLSGVLDFQVSGSQTISETGGTAFTYWTGVDVRAEQAGDIAQFTIDGTASVLITGVASGTPIQTGVYLESTVVDAIPKLVLNGNLTIQFLSPATNSQNIALHVAGGQLTGSGNLTIGTPETGASVGRGLVVDQTKGDVALTGLVKVYTTGPSVSMSYGTTSLDASGQPSASQFTSLGQDPSFPSTVVVSNDASLLLNNANVKLTNDGPPSAISQALDVATTTGNVQLNAVTVESDNSTDTVGVGNYAAGIDVTAGNLKAAGLSLTTQNDNVYGLLLDSSNSTAYVVLLCGYDGGTPTACATSGTASSNTITTNGAGAHGIFIDNANRTLDLTNTTVTTNGQAAAALAIGDGTVNVHSGNVFQANGTSGAAILYAPGLYESTTPVASVTIDPSTQVNAAGADSGGFVAAQNATVTLSPCSSTQCDTIASVNPTQASGLPFDNFHISGDNAAAVIARDGATVVLNGVNLGAASVAANAWGAKAGCDANDQCTTLSGNVQFTNGTTTSGLGIWAAAGGTLDFNDSTSDASHSLVRLDAGTTGGRLNFSGRTSALTVGLLESGGSGTSQGTVSLGANNLVLDGAAAAGSATFSGSIEGTGSLSLNASGTQTLSGATVLDYTGATNVTSGTLAVANGAIGRDVNGNWKDIAVGTGGTLDISANGGSFELGGISGSGAVQTGAAGSSSDLVLHEGGSQSFSGTIVGDGGLAMLGSGVETLSGSNVFDYTGATTIASGTLAVGGASGTQVANDTFTFDSASGTGGTLDVSAGGFTLGGLVATQSGTTAHVNLGDPNGAAANLTFTAATGTSNYSGTISGNGELIKQGASTQILSGIGAFGNTTGATAGTGQAVLDGGVLEIRNVDPSQLTYSFEMNGGWLDLSNNTFNPADQGGTNANQWTHLQFTEGPNASQGGVIGGNDKIVLGQDNADHTDTFQIGGTSGTGVSGPGVYVVKTGSGTETLTGHNLYVGTTQIQQGTLSVSADDNLGDPNYAREVILNGLGATLAITDSFTSNRQIQLQQDGTVSVGDANTSTVWSNVDGAGKTLIKTGAGALTFSTASTLGSAMVQGGSLSLNDATVDASALAGSAAITQNAGTAVSLSHGVVTSAADGIVANGTSTANLSNGTTVTSGAGYALYDVLSGTGTLNASQSQTLTGTLAADGAGSQLAINLSQASIYNGVPTLRNGATATMSIDSSSVWNLTGDATLTGLDNLGAITFGASTMGNATAMNAAMNAAIAAAANSTNYQTLTVNGDYKGGGTVNMRTELNAGGALANQFTDRLLISGAASGQTTLSLTTSGNGANTGTVVNGQAIPTQGISLVQVGGASTASAFTLAGGYVVAAGSPYQYRLFAFGPGSNTPPDPTQSLLPNGQAATWDYRLQSSDTGSSGNPQPCSGEPTCGRPTVVPQASSYLTTPLAIQNYEATIVDSVHRRLGEFRQDTPQQDENAGDLFARVIANRSIYHSNIDFQDYGYNFNQDIEALQIGGNWLHRWSSTDDQRFGVVATLGHTSVAPQASSIEASTASLDTYDLALTGTWQNKNGWYADGVVSAGRYTGTVSTEQHGEAGRVAANGFALSVEAGRAITLRNGIEIEPHVQALAQSLYFESRQDVDGVDVTTSDLQALTGRLGVRFTMPMPRTVSWKPYVRLDLQQTWMNTPTVTLSGQPFMVGSPGGAVQLGVGASGMVTDKLSLYGEVSGQQRLGHGFSSIEATLGLRYTF
jgi:outer membrane autotransporter protein